MIPMAIYAPPVSLSGHAQPRSLVIFSHHDFVGVSFEIGHLRQPMTLTQRTFRNIDQSALLAAVAYLPWDSLGNLSDANLKVFRLNLLFTTDLRTYNRHEANSLTWFGDAVLSAIQDRYSGNYSYRSSRSPKNWDRFRSSRNRATQIIRSAKRCFAGRTCPVTQRNFGAIFDYLV
jgi:hypothetical protein